MGASFCSACGGGLSHKAFATSVREAQRIEANEHAMVLATVCYLEGMSRPSTAAMLQPWRGDKPLLSNPKIRQMNFHGAIRFMGGSCADERYKGRGLYVSQGFADRLVFQRRVYVLMLRHFLNFIGVDYDSPQHLGGECRSAFSPYAKEME